uniref:5-hydroxytryptamine receptor 3A-like n=1 Tax=Knipowitschia caucasica TaxID=637954 RepID=A0AAV2KGM4_KNICA
MLIKKNLKSQPQAESCTTVVRIPEMEYQTLAVDTKRLRLISRLTATLEWTDPEMAWDTNVYPYDRASLPVDSVWTPAVYVTNAITVESQPSGKDLVVLSDGTLKHDVIVNAEVNCEINLFNYPFAADSCPVALHTWFSSGCGGEMSLWNVTMKDGAHGDWETQSIFYYQLEQNRNYILVDLKLRHINPFVTLMLPSILIIMADVVSFALPLGCGERNSFKVTLVLSFTMFLIILNGELPGDGQCSPIIRIHFCVCLVILVLSMLVSMILTRVAKEGGLIFCCCSKWITPKKDEVMDEETTPDVSFIQTEPEGEHTRILREVASSFILLLATTTRV